VRIARHSGGVTQTVMQVPGTPGKATVSEASETLPNLQAPTETKETGHIVKSPMVGTYYASPAPGAPPFVETGQSVNKGDVIGIIEAMKIMNQIEADVSGVVSKILVESGAPVEYGQPLFVIT
jgi:acetyl-CoA carboxylase, biotin carboxyl carrier protein